MTLVVAKSFENKREAIQGFCRVGRFGDNCTRISFKDVPLIDKKAEAAHNIQGFKFVSLMQKKPIQMKAIVVKEVSVPVQKAKPSRVYSSKLG